MADERSLVPSPRGRHVFDDVLGPRRPLGIGISVSEFLSDPVLALPGEEVLIKYGTNPRNQSGGWYEDFVGTTLRRIAATRGWSVSPKASLGFSKVHLTEKVVDFIVQSGSRKLGLELKYLKSDGSLIAPKCIVDALDFTNRPIQCIYVIDGPEWGRVKGRRGGGQKSYAAYLAHWWEFTNSRRLEETISRFFALPAESAPAPQASLLPRE